MCIGVFCKFHVNLLFSATMMMIKIEENDEKLKIKILLLFKKKCLKYIKSDLFLSFPRNKMS